MPQGLKPASFAALSGTAKAAPFPKPMYEAASSRFPAQTLLYSHLYDFVLELRTEN